MRIGITTALFTLVFQMLLSELCAQNFPSAFDAALASARVPRATQPLRLRLGRLGRRRGRLLGLLLLIGLFLRREYSFLLGRLGLVPLNLLALALVARGHGHLD